MYRSREGRLQVLLVHPGGPYWAKKQWQSWSIPKGEIDPGEDPFTAAKREFEEETGLIPEGQFQALQPVKQGGGKLVFAWSLPGDFEPQPQPTQTFEMEWPPRSGQIQAFPEVDDVRWFEITEARRRIIKAQLLFLDELLASVHTLPYPSDLCPISGERPDRSDCPGLDGHCIDMAQ